MTRGFKTAIKAISIGAASSCGLVWAAESHRPTMAAGETSSAFSNFYDVINTHNDATRNKQINRQIDQILLAISARRPEIRKIVDDKALNAVIHDQLRDVVFRHVERLRDARRAAMVDLISRSLTVAEAQYLTAFYSSPLGQRWREAEASHETMRSVLTKAADNGNKLDSAAFDRDSKASQEAANAAFFSSITQAERVDISKFIRSPAFVHMQAMMPSVARISAEFAAKPWDEEDLSAARAIINRFIELSRNQTPANNLDRKRG